MRDSTADAVLFFDVDCIPLDRRVIPDVFLPAIASGAVVGAERLRKRGKMPYPCVAAFAMGCSPEVYRGLGCPGMEYRGRRQDTAAYFSAVAFQSGVKVITLPKTSPERYAFTGTFGHADSGAVYHVAGIRGQESGREYIERCERVAAGLRNEP